MPQPFIKSLLFSVVGAFLISSKGYVEKSEKADVALSTRIDNQSVQQLWISISPKVKWIKKEWMTILPSFALSGTGIIYLSVLWKRPIWLLYLPTKFNIPGTKVSLAPSIVVWLKYRPRVLDAWVYERIQKARSEFDLRLTVEERLIHISLPILVNQDIHYHLEPKKLQSFCKQKLFRLLIVGEGGVGKTSLACQIAKWAMSDDYQHWLCAHPMIPVLIEEELDGTLLDAVSLQVRNLRNDERAVPGELLTQLLEKQRILVIVDHLSEMSEETRKAVKHKDPNSPINALIVTSRIETILGREITQTKIKPQRVSGKQLSIFMDEYLKAKGKRDLFEEDEDYFDALRRLSQLITENKTITVLLARLYADQMIYVTQEQALSDLPTTIPDLVLSYINELNRNVDSKIEDSVVQENAKIAAWECVKTTLKPETADRKQFIRQLLAVQEDDDIDPNYAIQILSYLENSLFLIRTVSPARKRFRFVLDPLAEYLAALYLVSLFQNSEEKWNRFFEEIYTKSDSLQEIQGFLLALRNCCEAEGSHNIEVPSDITQKLEQLAGLDPEVLAAERLKRRIRRLISDLSISDPEDRQRAAKEIGKIGTDAHNAIVALVKASKNPSFMVRASAVQAIGKLGNSSENVTQVLLYASEDAEPSVRIQAILALVELRVMSDIVQERLLDLLEDTELEVQSNAILGLGSIGKDRDTIVEKLSKMIDSDKANICLLSAKTLINLGHSNSYVVEKIVTLLDDENYELRVQAAILIGQLGNSDNLPKNIDRVTEKLEVLLSDRAPGVRTSAAQALINLDTGSYLATKGLLSLLDDTNAETRSDAAQRLGCSGRVSNDVVEALGNLLDDKNYQVRSSAAEALGKIGSSLPSILEKLLKLLDDKYTSVQANAARSLGLIGNSSREIIQKLISLIEDKDVTVRCDAIEALGKLHNTFPVARLINCLSDTDSLIRFQSACALVELGQTSTQIEKILCDHLKEGSTKDQLRAATALGEFETVSDDTSYSLIELLDNEEIEIQIQSASTLANLKVDSKNITNKLIHLLENDNIEIRQKAIQCLGELGSLSKSASSNILDCLETSLSNFDNEEELEDLAWFARTALIDINDQSEKFVSRLFDFFVDERKILKDASSKIIESLCTSSVIVVRELVCYGSGNDFKVANSALDILNNLIGSIEDSEVSGDVRKTLESSLSCLLENVTLETNIVAIYLLLRLSAFAEKCARSLIGSLEM